MDGGLQIGAGSDLFSLHATLKDRDCLVSAAEYDPFAEQLEQVGFRLSSTNSAPIMAKPGPRSSAPWAWANISTRSEAGLRFCVSASPLAGGGGPA